MAFSLRSDRITNRAPSPRRRGQDVPFAAPRCSPQATPNHESTSRSRSISTLNRLIEQQTQLQQSNDRIEKVLMELQQSSNQTYGGGHRPKLPKDLCVSSCVPLPHVARVRHSII